MTLFRRTQLKVNIFLRPKTRQALTVLVLRCFFVLDMNSLLPQAAVSQCFDNQNENANVTFAPIDLHPHGYVFVPGYWSKTDVAYPDGMTEFVVDHSVLVCVSNKLLTKR